MAVTLQRQFSINIANVVNQSIDAARSIRREERARREAEFQRAIADGLSYEEQISIREQHLKDERASSFADENYIADIEKTITETKKLSRFNQYRERYSKTLGDLNSGKINEEQYLSSLKKSLNGVVDPDLRLEIQNDISEGEKVVKNYRDSILANQVRKAKFDGTQKTLDDALTRVRNARAQAVISDNQDEVTAYDETLSALESQLFGVRVQDSINDFRVQSSTRGVSPLEKLNYINNELNGADGNRSIRVGNVSYRSAKEFWNLERDGYLAGTSSNFGNFFDELTTFTQNRIDSNIVQFGHPPQAILDDTFNVFTDLKGRAEVQPFANKLDITQAAVMADAVDQFAKKVIDSSETAQQFEFGVDQLNNLGKKYNVSTEIYSSQLFQRVRGLEQGGLISPGTTVRVAEKVNVEIPEITPTPKTTSTSDATLSAGGSIREVKSGDTLSAIARDAGISLNDLLELNPQFQANPNLIRSGQSVNLPEPILTQDPKPTSTPNPTPTLIPTPQPNRSTQPPNQTRAQEATPPFTPATQPPNQTRAPVSTASTYQGSNIVDYLKSTGQDSSFAARSKIAAEKGIQNYTGSAEQNTKLLNILRQ